MVDGGEMIMKSSSIRSNKSRSSLVLALFVAAAAQAAPPALIKLKGIDPAVYMLKRNHKPDVSAELRLLPADVAVAVLNNAAAFVVDDTAYPAGLTGHVIATLRAAELRALVQGALTSLAQRQDPRAFDALLKHVGHADANVAAVAAERLGELKDLRIVATLSTLVHNDMLRDPVRAGACAGLGRQRNEAALEALLPALAPANKSDLRVAALRALGSLSSRWAFEARGDPATGDLLRARALSAIEGVSGDDVVGAVRAEMLNLLR